MANYRGTFESRISAGAVLLAYCEKDTLGSSVGRWEGESSELGIPVCVSSARSIPVSVRS